MRTNCANKSIAILGLLILFIGVSSAVNQTTSYQNHSLSFEIPLGWNVVKDIQEENDHMILLTDNISAIRIDIIKSDDPLIISDSADSRILCEYYIKYVINLVKPICGSGTGVEIKPDGADDVFYASNCCGLNKYCKEEGFNDPVEWIVTWTKPEYDKELIGVYAIFNGTYPDTKINWSGAHGDYYMANPLYSVLTSISLENGLKKPSKETSIIDIIQQRPQAARPRVANSNCVQAPTWHSAVIYKGDLQQTGCFGERSYALWPMSDGGLIFVFTLEDEGCEREYWTKPGIIKTNTWNHIKVYLNTKEEKVEIFVNGTKIYVEEQPRFIRTPMDSKPIKKETLL